MKAQEFVDLIEELNEALLDNKYFEDQFLCFNYRCYGYVDGIYFGNHNVYCSENDSTWDHDKNVEISVKDVVIKNFKDYVKALKQVKL